MTTLPAEITKSYSDLMKIKVVVNSPETEVEVRKHYGACSTWLKVNKKLFDTITQPFKKAIADLKAPYDRMKEDIERMEGEAFRALAAWERKQTAKVETSNQKAIERFEVKAANAEARAINEGKPVPVTPLPNLKAAPAKTVELDGAAQTWVDRKDWWLANRPVPYDKDGLYIGEPSKEFKGYTMRQNSMEIRPGDMQMIPMEYFVLDTAKIGAVMRAGGSIPGIQVVNYKTLSQREAK